MFKMIKHILMKYLQFHHFFYLYYKSFPNSIQSASNKNSFCQTLNFPPPHSITSTKAVFCVPYKNIRIEFLRIPQINLVIHIKQSNIMLNEHLILNTPKFFAPITPQISSAIRNDAFRLQGQFYHIQKNSNIVKVILTKSYLSIQITQSNIKTQHLYTHIDFTLKCNMIYQDDLKGVQEEKVILSKTVGFSITKDGKEKMDLVVVDHKYMDIWEKYLNKSMNQLGFHRLFKPIRKLGKGGFATVYQVERVTDGKHFAVKAFAKQNTINSPDQAQAKGLLNEIKALRKMDCSNVLKLQGVFETDNSLYLVLELIQGGQLHTKINKRDGDLSIAEIKQIMMGLAKGLKELHQNGIMHRDIKPQNIMLRGENGLEPVIADLGLSAFYEEKQYVFYRCGTPGYVAPEITKIIEGQKVGPVCDIFSAGVIFHILLTKRQLFPGRKFDQVYQNNCRMKFNLNGLLYNTIDCEAYDLLTKMLKIDPNERIKAHQILSHPFLSSQMIDEQKQALSTLTHFAVKSVYA